MAVINGVVGNNTHRKLKVEEFRGFALTDRYAPLIFVNGADWKSAQMFTLAHELAHVWLGPAGEGLTGFEGVFPADTGVEGFCDRAAVEFLVPARALKQQWPRLSTKTRSVRVRVSSKSAPSWPAAGQWICALWTVKLSLTFTGLTPNVSASGQVRLEVATSTTPRTLGWVSALPPLLSLLRWKAGSPSSLRGFAAVPSRSMLVAWGCPCREKRAIFSLHHPKRPHLGCRSLPPPTPSASSRFGRHRRLLVDLKPEFPKDVVVLTALVLPPHVW